MSALKTWRRPIMLVGLYLLVAVPPYAALNWAIVTDILSRSLPPSPLEVGAVVVVTLALLGALAWGADGADRFVQILLAPSDWLSVLVVVSFLLAAASWWVVPEVLLSTYGRVDIAVLYFAVFVCHVPMVLFLSLLTIAGLTRENTNA